MHGSRWLVAAAATWLSPYLGLWLVAGWSLAQLDEGPGMVDALAESDGYISLAPSPWMRVFSWWSSARQSSIRAHDVAAAMGWRAIESRDLSSRQLRLPLVLVIRGKRVRTRTPLLDTGSEVSIVSRQFALRCGLPVTSDEPERVDGLGGKVWSVGRTQFAITDPRPGRPQIAVDALVVDNFPYDVLIGMDALAHSCVPVSIAF